MGSMSPVKRTLLTDASIAAARARVPPRRSHQRKPDHIRNQKTRSTKESIRVITVKLTRFARSQSDGQLQSAAIARAARLRTIQGNQKRKKFPVLGGEATSVLDIN